MCSNTFVHVRGVPRIGEKGQSIRPPLPVLEISLIYNSSIICQYLHRLAFWSSQPPSLAHELINSPSNGHLVCKADILKTIHSTLSIGLGSKTTCEREFALSFDHLRIASHRTCRCCCELPACLDTRPNNVCALVLRSAFLGDVFGCSTPSKKRCIRTQEFTRFLSNGDKKQSQRRATRSDVSFQTK